MKTVNQHHFIEVDGNKQCKYCGLTLIHKNDDNQLSFTFMNRAIYPKFAFNSGPVTVKDFDNCRGYKNAND